MVAYDPLSDRTRLAKRNLMAISLIIIAYRGFNITVNEVEFAGTKITMQPDVIPFLLAASGLWFSVSFITSWYIDIKNPGDDQFISSIGKSSDSFLRGLANAIYERAISIAYISKNLSIDEKLKTTAMDAIKIYGLQSNLNNAIRSCIIISGRYEEDDMNRIIRSIDERIYEGSLVYRAHKAASFSKTAPMSFVYFLKNVLIDMFFPILMAAYAGYVLWFKPEMQWIKNIVPSAN